MNDQTLQPAAIYEKELEKQELLMQQYLKRQSLLGWLRLAAVALTAVAAYHLFLLSSIAGVIAILAGIGIFLFLVAQDVNNQHNINHTARLVSMNREELAVMQYQYIGRPDGIRFQPEQHTYALDLDIFGKASLYQYINRCHSDQGQQLLAKNLLEPLPATSVAEYQEAVREIVPSLGWRQNLQAYAMASPVSIRTEKVLEQWVNSSARHFKTRFWRFFVPFYSVATLTVIAFAIAGLIPINVFSFLFVLFFAFSTILSKNAQKDYADLGGIIKETDTIYQLVKCVEEKRFQTPLLQQMQYEAGGPQAPAHVQLKQLKQILNRFDLRLNVMIFIFVNSFLLWDVRQILSLNNWRDANKTRVASWFRMIASFEVWNSLATLTFNQPSWAFPSVTADHFTLQGTAIGHPLIPEDIRVASDFTMAGRGKVAIVTGSNMAGKSTFLRSLGTNLVLAQMGAPVCAAAFVCSPVQLMSSMRIADNLAESTSTFYAELKKLKTILEAVNRKEHVFILLDEILRGTNSLDRHTGSMAFVRQLIREEAVAVIATHDLAIGNLEKEHPAAIQNYHFDVQVAGEELFFDYKLKNGICTSLNASLLMKKIGIDL